MTGNVSQEAGLSHLVGRFSRIEYEGQQAICGQPHTPSGVADPSRSIRPNGSPDGRQCRVFAEQSGHLSKNAALLKIDVVLRETSEIRHQSSVPAPPVLSRARSNHPMPSTLDAIDNPTWLASDRRETGNSAETSCWFSGTLRR